MSRFVFPGVYVLKRPPSLVGNPPTAAGLSTNPPAQVSAPPPPPPPPPPSNNPDWSTLDVWNSFLPNTPNGVPGGFSGWSQTGATFMVYLDDRNLGGGGSDIEAGAFFVIYNGPGQNCLVTVDMSQWGGPVADGDAVGKFTVTQGDGNLVATVLATAVLSNYNRTISGNTLLVPFTLGPGVTGVSDTILIQGAFVQPGIFTDGWIEVFLHEAVRFQITATVSNV